MKVRDMSEHFAGMAPFIVLARCVKCKTDTALKFDGEGWPMPDICPGCGGPGPFHAGVEVQKRLPGHHGEKP